MIRIRRGQCEVVAAGAFGAIVALIVVSRAIFTNAAGAICGMVEAPNRVAAAAPAADKPLIVASMFGNTTPCVTEAKRLIAEAPRTQSKGAPSGDEDEDRESPWPDLVLIDGGQGQLNAARDALAALGVTDVPLIGVAKGPDRDAGNETFYLLDRPAGDKLNHHKSQQQDAQQGGDHE